MRQAGVGREGEGRREGGREEGGREGEEILRGFLRSWFCSCRILILGLGILILGPGILILVYWSVLILGSNPDSAFPSDPDSGL